MAAADQEMRAIPEGLRAYMKAADLGFITLACIAIDSLAADYCHEMSRRKSGMTSAAFIGGLLTLGGILTFVALRTSQLGREP